MPVSEEQLVIWAEEIVANLQEQLRAHVDTGRTQASKAIEVAQATGSLLVFRNWLRYQRAREEFWKVGGDGGRDLAEWVHEAIGRIERETSGPDTMAAVTRFLGYFRRVLVAINHLQQIPPARERRGA